jgi:hypothetical protein
MAASEIKLRYENQVNMWKWLGKKMQEYHEERIHRMFSLDEIQKMRTEEKEFTSK